MTDQLFAGRVLAWLVAGIGSLICCVVALGSGRAATHCLRLQPISASRVDPAHQYALASSTETTHIQNAMKTLVALTVLPC